jgi:hypothetical protein
MTSLLFGRVAAEFLGPCDPRPAAYSDDGVRGKQSSRKPKVDIESATTR